MSKKNRLCRDCDNFGANTHFKKWGGKSILENQCVIAGRRLVTDPPRIVNPDTKCELTFDLWKAKKEEL